MGIQIAKHARIGLVLKGGPVNGPFATGAACEIQIILDRMGLVIQGIYANSASVPDGVMASIGQSKQCCEIWSSLTPTDIVGDDLHHLTGKARAMYNALFGESIFSGLPLRQVLARAVPLDAVFATSAIPVKFMTVDFWSGTPFVFSNKNPDHKDIWILGMDASMALVPFRPAVTVRNMLLFDGGYSDNLMLDEACHDGMDVLLTVDINELGLGPLESKNWHRWTNTLPRAFHILVTTNDQRREHGVQRTNEILAIRDHLRMVIETFDSMPEPARASLRRAIERLDTGLLGLHDKHRAKIITIGDRPNSIPFNFADFQPEDVTHLIECGRRAARRTLADLEIV